jgi:hypothetical protein
MSLRPLGSDVVAEGWRARLPLSHVEAPLRFEVRAHNFSEQPLRGTWKLRLPAGWQPEPPTATAGKLALPPLADSATVIVLRPSAGISSARRDPITLEWRGTRGDADRCIIRMRRGRPGGGACGSISSGLAIARSPALEWGRQQADSGTRLSLVKQAVGTTAGVILPLPGLKRLADDDVLRLRLRLVEPARPVALRCELITLRREVFRHGEDQPLSTEWQTLEWRVGDFTPAFWSHVGLGLPTESRYLRLGLFGLREGQSLEVAPARAHPGSARRRKCHGVRKTKKPRRSGALKNR